MLENRKTLVTENAVRTCLWTEKPLAGENADKNFMRKVKLVVDENADRTYLWTEKLADENADRTSLRTEKKTVVAENRVRTCLRIRKRMVAGNAYRSYPRTENQ